MGLFCKFISKTVHYSTMTPRVPMSAGCTNAATACDKFTKLLVKEGKRYKVGANALELSEECQKFLKDLCLLLNLLAYMSEDPSRFPRWIANSELQMHPFIRETMATLQKQGKTQFGEFGGMFLSWTADQWQAATDILVEIITKKVK